MDASPFRQLFYYFLISASQRFFRLARLPDRTWQAKTSQITRVAMRLVISAAS